jgi:acyl dehydratase
MTYEEVSRLAGQELGTSDWRLVDQGLVDRFAALTGDDGFPHVDPVRAATTPFGGTIAHGLLLLALYGGMAKQVIPVISNRRYLLAYGWDRIRFTAPVRTGRYVRARVLLQSAHSRSPTEGMLRFAVTVECDDAKRPVLVGESLQLVVLRSELDA